MVIFLVGIHCLLDALRRIKNIFFTDNHFCAFDNPFKARPSTMPEEVIRIVFDVLRAFDFCFERNDYQPAPNTIIGCTHLWEMVCVKHKGMAGLELKGCFIFLFCLNIVRRRKLLYRGGIESLTFLKLCRNQEPFAFGFCEFRLDIAFASHGQGICRDCSAICT